MEQTITNHRYPMRRVRRYLMRIGFIEYFPFFSYIRLTQDERLWFLRQVMACHLATVPFENINLHYSWHRSISLDPDILFEKIVEQTRGGCGLEINTFMYYILTSLGFDVYLAGARLYNERDCRWEGLNHCVNIVMIDDVRYQVDMCPGYRNPTAPLPLLPEPTAYDHCGGNVGLCQVRYGTLQEGNGRHPIWIYEYRPVTTPAWAVVYTFTDLAFALEDMEVLSESLMRSPASGLVQRLICLRLTIDPLSITRRSKPNFRIPNVGPLGIKEPLGCFYLVDNVLQSCQGHLVLWEKSYHTEEERVQLLEQYFHVSLSSAEKQGIRGKATEIRRVQSSPRTILEPPGSPLPTAPLSGPPLIGPSLPEPSFQDIELSDTLLQDIQLHELSWADFHLPDAPLPDDLPQGAPLPDDLSQGAPLQDGLSQAAPLQDDSPQAAPLPDDLIQGALLLDKLSQGTPLSDNLSNGAPLQDVSLPDTSSPGPHGPARTLHWIHTASSKTSPPSAKTPPQYQRKRKRSKFSLSSSDENSGAESDGGNDEDS